jgi:phosphatidate cytidylyltransferase
VSEQGSDLLTRVLSAGVLLPIALFFLFKGGWWFFALVVVVLSLATWECVHMFHLLGYRSPRVLALCVVWAVLAGFGFPESRLLLPALAVAILCGLTWHILQDKSATPVENWLLPLGGAIYIAWMGGHLLLVRALPQGSYRLIAVLGIVMLADSAAYFCGRAWGRHRMCPRLSPKKTWEGFAAGVVAAAVSGPLFFAALARWVGTERMAWEHGLVLGLLLGTLTPLGDLGISMIKRQAGVKDSGHLIPGHGGALDRIDSWIVAAVIGYCYYVGAMGVSPAW